MTCGVVSVAVAVVSVVSVAVAVVSVVSVAVAARPLPSCPARRYITYVIASRPTVVMLYFDSTYDGVRPLGEVQTVRCDCETTTGMTTSNLFPLVSCQDKVGPSPQGTRGGP